MPVSGGNKQIARVPFFDSFLGRQERIESTYKLHARDPLKAPYIFSHILDPCTVHFFGCTSVEMNGSILIYMR
jgi:hypothetical protein